MFEPFKAGLEEAVELLATRLENKIGGMMGQRFETCYPEENKYICSFLAQDWMANPGGTLHGGIISTMFDQVLGVHAIQASGQLPTPTTHMNITFCRPVPIGARVFVSSKIISRTRSTLQIFGEAWLEGNPEKIVAYATESYHVIPDAN